MSLEQLTFESENEKFDSAKKAIESFFERNMDDEELRSVNLE